MTRAKTTEERIFLEKQENDLTFSDDDKTDADKARQEEGNSSLSSSMMTPASDSSSNGAYSSRDNKDDKLEKAEMARLKQELDAAKNQIARQKQELDQTRIMKHTIHEAVGSSTEAEVKTKENGFVRHHGPANSPGRNGVTRHDNHWEGRSVMSDGTSVNDFGPTQHVWGSSNRPAFNGLPTSVNQQYQSMAPAWGQPGARTWGNRQMTANVQPIAMPTQQQMLQSRTFSGPASPVANNDYTSFQTSQGIRRSNTQNRAASFYPQARDNTWDIFGGGIGSLDGMTIGVNPSSTYQNVGMYSTPLPYQPRPIGTPLSPEAAEFRAGQASTTPWNTAVSLSISSCGRCANPWPPTVSFR